MSNNTTPSIVTDAAAQQAANAGDAKLASFTFIMESRSGFVAEGCYPNVTPEQYKIVVAALEGKFDAPKIILAGA